MRKILNFSKLEEKLIKKIDENYERLITRGKKIKNELVFCEKSLKSIRTPKNYAKFKYDNPGLLSNLLENS